MARDRLGRSAAASPAWRATRATRTSSSAAGAEEASGGVSTAARPGTRVGFPQPDVFSVAVGPVDGALYAGCEPSMLFVSRDRGERWAELASLREIPSAPTWSFPPRPWTSHVRWIAPSPHDAALLLVGIELGGVMRSEDGGETWSDHRPGAQLDCHSLAWHPTAARPGLRGGRPGRSLEPRRRRDVEARRRRARPPLHLGGRRRSRGSRPMVRLCEHGAVRGARPPLRRGGRLPPARRGAVGRPGGTACRSRWTRCRTHSRSPTAVLAAGLADGTVYATGDGGESWERGTGRGRPSRRGSWPSPSGRRPAPRGARRSSFCGTLTPSSEK